MNTAIKSILVIVILAVIGGYSAKYFFSFQSSSFPEIGDKTFLGKFSEYSNDGPASILSDASFLLIKTPSSSSAMFLLLKQGSEVETLSLQLIDSAKGAETRYESLRILPRLGCRMSGAFSGETLRGQVFCHDGGKVSFSAHEESAFLSRLFDEVSGSSQDSKLRTLLSSLSQVEQASEYIQGLNAKKLSVFEELRKITDAEKSPDELKDGVQELKAEVSALEADMKKLEEKNTQISAQRDQLFRTSEKGVEVDLRRRLAKMESDIMYRGWGMQEAPNDELPSIGVMEYPSESTGAEAKEAEVREEKQGASSNEWWKDL